MSDHDEFRSSGAKTPYGEALDKIDRLRRVNEGLVKAAEPFIGRIHRIPDLYKCQDVLRAALRSATEKGKPT